MPFFPEQVEKLDEQSRAQPARLGASTSHEEIRKLREVASAARAYLHEAKRLHPHIVEQNPILARLQRALNDD